MVTISQLKMVKGAAGVGMTAGAMLDYIRKDAADNSVRRLAVAHLAQAGILGHSFLAEIKSLFELVRDRIIYRRDPVGVERVQDTLRTFQYGAGDCDDKAVALASLLAAVGHKSRLVFGAANAQASPSHVWLQVKHKGEWLDLDPSNEKAEIGWSTALPYKYLINIFEDGPSKSSSRATDAQLINRSVMNNKGSASSAAGLSQADGFFAAGLLLLCLLVFVG